MQNKFAILISIFILLIAGCNSPFQQMTTTEGICPAPQLGMIVDDNSQVLDIFPNGPAAKAGLQIGDVLLDGTWVKIEVSSACNDSISFDANGSPLPIPTVNPANFVEPDHPIGPVPFTNKEQIRNMIAYGATMTLRIVRDEKELELTIIPGIITGPRPVTPNAPTATPITTGFTSF